MKETKFHPVILEFKELIDKDPTVRMYITQMIEQISLNHKNVRNIEDLLCKLNELLETAPTYSQHGLSICPLSEILVHTMSTPTGRIAYSNEKINAMIKNILIVWAKFLSSKESLYVINDSPSGWKCKKAQKQLSINEFQYDPSDKYWGFKSWNDFFTRRLADGARPIAEPNNNKIIVSACDATVIRISENVQKYSKFWIKSQPYSLNDMLVNDQLTDRFVGGGVYQALLSPFNYHRWHCPVSGTIKKAFVKDGLYFSKTIVHTQTRAIIFIEADDPKIGLMCFMPVGMVEVSSCIIDPKIKPGYHIKKGEELGCFQFGGSTHCLIFRPEVIKEFNVKVQQFCKVGEKIATANS